LAPSFLFNDPEKVIENFDDPVVFGWGVCMKRECLCEPAKEEGGDAKEKKNGCRNNG